MVRIIPQVTRSVLSPEEFKALEAITNLQQA